MARQSSVVVSMLLLGAMLVLLPLGSFLYLRAGYDYRVESLNELDPLGNALPFGLEQSTEEEPRIYVVYSTPSSASDSVARSIVNVHETFTHEPSVMFLGLGESAQPIVDDKMQGIQVALTSRKKELFKSLSAGSSHCENVPLDHQALIIDREGIARRCYDLHSGPDVTRLVEHLTILVPPAPVEDMFLEREKEY